MPSLAPEFDSLNPHRERKERINSDLYTLDTMCMFMHTHEHTQRKTETETDRERKTEKDSHTDVHIHASTLHLLIFCEAML